ncbi:copper chaperone CopZ [Vagococcus coleopterorum]|uniref:Copper chaperone CopZ n=1 Tax=Vagococcus coleopterorum TaxID=2714946 RepID=A0A6G8AN56_9ENTE|nr:copper chaperone CopZ [Vagococcus coleopterorum]QIL46511.1 copper chaperone CopZ [Vagococcus coleopterorum]
MKLTFKVSGMSCEHCVANVEKQLEELDGVKKVKVNLKKETAKVKYDEKEVGIIDLVSAIKNAGYGAEVI